MIYEDLQELNERILIMAHELSVRDIDQAAVVLNVPRDVAFAISELSVNRLRLIARNARFLIQPSTLNHDLWKQLQGVDDDAAAALPILTNNPHCR